MTTEKELKVELKKMKEARALAELEASKVRIIVGALNRGEIQRDKNRAEHPQELHKMLEQGGYNQDKDGKWVRKAKPIIISEDELDAIIAKARGREPADKSKQDVLRVLGNIPQNIAQISERLGKSMPKNTIKQALKRLEKLGIVAKTEPHKKDAKDRRFKDWYVLVK